jgi:hypothetical protein
MSVLILVIVFAAFLILGLIVVYLATGKGKRVTEPSCGNCGYATRGISTLNCPECGADLKEVGIVMPGDGRSALLAGCMMPLLVTIVIFLLAVGGIPLATLVVPSYETQSTHFDVWPDSDAYGEILFRTEKTLIIPASERHLAHSFSISTNYGTPNVTTIDYGGGKNTTVKVDSIAFEVMSMPHPTQPNAITYAPSFRVDPKTSIATWSDAQGKTQTSKGPVTDKDLLAYFAARNVDTSKPEVVAEVQQLTAMIDGLIAGNKQFTLQGFENGGYGSGSSGSIGPKWAILVYVIAWIVIWIVVLLFLLRRSRRKVTSTS